MEFKMNEMSDAPKISETENNEISEEAKRNFEKLMGDDDLPENPAFFDVDPHMAETDGPIYDENGAFELNDKERQMLKDKLGWSDKKIDDNCRIDADDVIHYKTDCQGKEGQAADCGVYYERKIFTYRDVEIEGVFPVFHSVFDTELPEENYQSSNVKQFSECNKKLGEGIKDDPDLKNAFTKEQLGDIEAGRTPRGYTWHHMEEPGKMQLVRTEEHDRRIGGAAHTGGNSIWGNKSVEKPEERTQKGVAF